MRFDPERPVICLITKGDAKAENFVEKRDEILDLMRIAVDEKVSLIQLREKKLSAKLIFELAKDAAAITRDSETRLLVNDRADIALAAGADGVHLAAKSLSAAIVRKDFPDLIIGASTHTLDEAVNASREGADFGIFGPIFETPGKNETQGIAKLSEVCQRLSNFPVLAIGGIDEENFSSVLDAGAAGFAAIRTLTDPASLRSICYRVRNEK